MSTGVLVAGGGAVGAAAALSLAACGHAVTLVEAQQPKPWDTDHVDPRVYALSPASIAQLESLGVWADVAARRAQPFTGMQVWDRDGSIQFDAAEFGLPALGSIVEDAALTAALWAALEPAGVIVHCPARIASVEQAARSVTLNLDGGDALTGAVLVAADGARSRVRRAAGIRTEQHSYAARAIVAHVRSELPHADTAWQRFTPDGPIGLLPLADGRLSVVWSAGDAAAARLLALDDAAFCAALGDALDGRLGAITEASARYSFPLVRQHALAYAQDRVVLVGDAAHSIHPLAGQGLNLGLADVAALAASLDTDDLAAPETALRAYARDRRAENRRMIAATDGLDRLFSNANPLLRAVRGVGLSAVDSLPAVKRALAQVSIGTAA